MDKPIFPDYPPTLPQALANARRKFAEITSGYPRLFRHWRWVTSAW